MTQAELRKEIDIILYEENDDSDLEFHGERVDRLIDLINQQVSDVINTTMKEAAKIEKKGKERKKMYIITAGEYSDYHICGVYDDKEKAQEYIDVFAKDEYSEMMIEDFMLNPYELEISEGMRPYFLRMDREGNVYDIHVRDSSYKFNYDDISHGFDVNDNLYNHCFARNEEHAVKITSELKFRLEAEGKWPSK